MAASRGSGGFTPLAFHSNSSPAHWFQLLHLYPLVDTYLRLSCIEWEQLINCEAQQTQSIIRLAAEMEGDTGSGFGPVKLATKDVRAILPIYESFG